MLLIPRKAAEELLYEDGNLLRIYLYGLLHQQGDPDQMAEELGINKAALMQGIELLQMKGFFRTDPQSGGKILFISYLKKIKKILR